MNIQKEVRMAEIDMSGIIEEGLIKYKGVLKQILELDMEELYGGSRTLPKCTEENEEAVIKIWNQAVEKCIEIVKSI